jgi:hypothetical protein
MNLTFRRNLLAVAALAAVAGTAVAQSGPSAPGTPQAAPQAVPPATGPGAGPMGPGAGPRMGPMGPGYGPHQGPHHGRMGPGAERPDRMAALDTDRDGKVSRAEFEAGQRAMQQRANEAFDKADADRDGALSVDERRAFRDQLRAQWAGPQGAGYRHRGAPGQPAAPGTPATPAAPARPATPGV